MFRNVLTVTFLLFSDPISLTEAVLKKQPSKTPSTYVKPGKLKPSSYPSTYPSTNPSSAPLTITPTNAGPTTGMQPYKEQVVLTSGQKGVLEVNLYCRQGEGKMDTVSKPVKNMMLYSYKLIRGFSNGKTEDTNLYPAPSLQVWPGEQLIINFINELTGLTIPDFYDPAFVFGNATIPLYPPALTKSSINNHIHGVHVSPQGNQDNIIIEVPAGKMVTYDYAVSSDMPQGLYWYHQHRHTITEAHTTRGLSGLLYIGRTDGNLPIVTANNLPVRSMSLHVTNVFNRPYSHTLNNPFLSSYVSTLVPPQEGELEAGTYQPFLTPINFLESANNSTFITEWFAGPNAPSDPNNSRGYTQYFPQIFKSFQSFPNSTKPITIEANYSVPDYERDVQYLVNGQFQPVLELAPGQTEIWSIANIHSMAYATVQLTETATGNHPAIVIVGQDGVPRTDATDARLLFNNNTIVIPPGARFSFAVTMPLVGDLIMEMPPIEERNWNLFSTSQEAVAYTNIDGKTIQGTLGTETIDPTKVSWYDFQFVYPTQVLLYAKSVGAPVASVSIVAGQPLNAYTGFQDLKSRTPDVIRTTFVGSTAMSYPYNMNDTLNNVNMMNNNVFPYTPLAQPRLGSVEEWVYINSADDHPMHIHIQDMQTFKRIDPNHMTKDILTAAPYGQDIYNIPAAKPLNGSAFLPGIMVFRSTFENYTGAYVSHCHRLVHEDTGLMQMVNVIPAVSIVAIGVAGTPIPCYVNVKTGFKKPVPSPKMCMSDSYISVYDQKSNVFITKIVPFPGFSGQLSVAVGDVNNDNIEDVLVTPYTPGFEPRVRVYSGATGMTYSGATGTFTTLLADFLVYFAKYKGGLTVTAGGIDGSGKAENIIVGSGPGIQTSIIVYNRLPTVTAMVGETMMMTMKSAPTVWTTFYPFQQPCIKTVDMTGISGLATGLIDVTGGRISIIAAVGTHVRAFTFQLLEDIAAAAQITSTNYNTRKKSPSYYCPDVAADFMPWGTTYNGPLSIATGFTEGAFGGTETILVSQTTAPGNIGVFSSGSKLDGWPTVYEASPNNPNYYKVTFKNVLTFSAYNISGSTVSTASTVRGADVFVSGYKNSLPQVSRYALAPSNITFDNLLNPGQPFSALKAYLQAVINPVH